MSNNSIENNFAPSQIQHITNNNERLIIDTIKTWIHVALEKIKNTKKYLHEDIRRYFSIQK